MLSYFIKGGFNVRNLCSISDVIKIQIKLIYSVVAMD